MLSDKNKNAKEKTDAKTVAGGSTAFVSGADEKTLRVFDAPGTFLGTLARSLPLADRAGRAALEAARARASDASGGAELPQLGLSNKALRAPEAAAAHAHAPCVLCYEEEYGLFSVDGKYRFGFAVSARDENHWSCKLKIWPLSSQCLVSSTTTTSGANA